MSVNLLPLISHYDDLTAKDREALHGITALAPNGAAIKGPDALEYLANL